MLRKTLSAAILFLLALTPPVLKGDISVGVNIGLTYDQNNMEPEINTINARMEKYKYDNPGTDMTPLNIPYSPVFGANIRVSRDIFMMRAGMHYAKQFMYPPSGNIAPGGNDNIIEGDSYSFSLPLTLGISLSAGFNTSVYFGAGPGLYYSYIKLTQSDPGNGFLDPDEPKLLYKTRHYGWNFIAGLEIPVHERITLTAEWLYQNGRSGNVKCSKTGNKLTMDSTTSMILFGVNYYLRSDL